MSGGIAKINAALFGSRFGVADMLFVGLVAHYSTLRQGRAVLGVMAAFLVLRIIVQSLATSRFGGDAEGN